MILDEVMDTIRAMLNDPLEVVSEDVGQTYSDDDIISKMPSALRYLRSVGVSIDTLLDVSGELAPEPSERQGTLLASRIASGLLRGELTRRLLNGNFGMIFRMGNDLIDTKTAAIQFQGVSKDIEQEFEILLALELSAENEVFGGPNSPGS